jgi:hypothetical protein
VVSRPSAAHHPAIEAALEEVREACRQCKLQGYVEIMPEQKKVKQQQHEKKKKKKKKKRKKVMVKQGREEGGYLKYLLLNVDAASSRVQLTVVWDSPPPAAPAPGPEAGRGGEEEEAEQVLSSFLVALHQQRQGGGQGGGEEGGSVIDSVWVHYNPTSSGGSSSGGSSSGGSGNSITSRAPASWRHVSGPGVLSERLLLPAAACSPARSLVFPPHVFRQANTAAFRHIIHSIRHWVADYALNASSTSVAGAVDTRKPRCLELYGGG